ncbi:hypothetical protein C7N43_39645 [Sphingobacteriales bacterium UPWRP_1]|nr:hypothetical protein C7N43_39645 [Sphingobacteriales bacterium UPWRP_1]
MKYLEEQNIVNTATGEVNWIKLFPHLKLNQLDANLIVKSPLNEGSVNLSEQDIPTLLKYYPNRLSLTGIPQAPDLEYSFRGAPAKANAGVNVNDIFLSEEAIAIVRAAKALSISYLRKLQMQAHSIQQTNLQMTSKKGTPPVVNAGKNVEDKG